MTEKRSSTTRPTRRKIDLAPNPFDAPAPEVEAVADPEPAVKAAPKRAPRQVPAKSKAAPAAAAEPASREEPPMIDADLRAGEQSWNEGTFKLTVNIPMSLHRRSSGIVLNHAVTGEPAEIGSLTDLVRISLAEVVGRYEKALNGGNEFPAPKAGLPRGRRSAGS